MVQSPSPEKIIEFNLLALELIKSRKADRPKVLNNAKLRVEDNPEKAKVMLGIRESYYTNS